MNRETLSNGAIACSVMILYSWAQAAASEPPLNGEAPLSHPHHFTGDRTADTSIPTHENHPSLIANNAPNAINPVEWSHQQSSPLPAELETVYGKLLKQAQTLAHQQQFAKAVVHVAGIPQNSRSFGMAQQLQTEWSREMIRQARHHYRQARVTQALAALNNIPDLPTLDSQVMELRNKWNQQATILNRAIAAQKAKDWKTVMLMVRSLENTPLYHSPTVQQLLQQAMLKLYEPDAALLQLATNGLPPLQTNLN